MSVKICSEKREARRRQSRQPGSPAESLPFGGGQYVSGGERSAVPAPCSPLLAAVTKRGEP
jgi:hypothetical protein